MTVTSITTTTRATNANNTPTDNTIQRAATTTKTATKKHKPINRNQAPSEHQQQIEQKP
jgi:hypothetical protein